MLYYSKYDDIYKIIKRRRIFEELEERERERDSRMMLTHFTCTR